MIKILVVSDSHGDVTLLKKIIEQNQTCDIVIHLGDKYTDGEYAMTEFAQKAFLRVAGNCDFVFGSSDVKSEGVFTVEQRRIFFTHGHKYNVKYSEQPLIMQAKMNNADIALFGHTHVFTAFEKDGVVVINLGSISVPRDGSGGTYCVLEIEGKNVKYIKKEVQR